MTMKQTADMEYIPHLQLKIRLITGLGIVTLLLSIVLFLSYHYAVRQVIVEGNGTQGAFWGQLPLPVPEIQE